MQTYAAYLASYLDAKEGYERLCVPEAEALEEACDHVLTLTDGLSFRCVGIVDATGPKAKGFDMGFAELKAIAKACKAKYSGTVNGASLPAQIEIIEVRQEVGEADLARLKPLKMRLGNVILAYSVDLSRGKAHSNGWSLLSPRKRMLERMLREPRLKAAELKRAEEAALPEVAGPNWLSWTLLALLAGVFGLELYLSGSLWRPDGAVLLAMGALSRYQTLELGEWHRLFSATLLHADGLHLIFNSIALWMAGSVLEPLLGRRHFMAIFTLSALVGSVVSLGLNDAGMYSVGASGAVMGLFSSAYVVSFRLPSGGGRSELQIHLLRVLIPSLLPLFALSGQRIDYAAHLGGALAGLAHGWALLKTWPHKQPEPSLQPLATALTVIGVLAYLFSAQQCARNYASHLEENQLSQVLMPEERIPKDDNEGAALGPALVKEFPRDPRSHLYAYLGHSRAKRLTQAEAELRTALSEPKVLKLFKPAYVDHIHVLLLRNLLLQGKMAQARIEAQPFCKGERTGEIVENLRKLGICK